MLALLRPLGSRIVVCTTTITTNAAATIGLDTRRARCIASSTTMRNRMAQYEAATCSQLLDPACPFVVRVDGCCFRNFTRHYDRPFDPVSMCETHASNPSNAVASPTLVTPNPNPKLILPTCSQSSNAGNGMRCACTLQSRNHVHA
jgi:hypothetical protein